jgi:hypothetical protein
MLCQKRCKAPSRATGARGDFKYNFAAPWNNLVVETTSGVQACVVYLRKNNLGRTTFLILEQLRCLESKSSQYFRGISTPSQQAPRMFDLVKVNDETLVRMQLQRVLQPALCINARFRGQSESAPIEYDRPSDARRHQVRRVQALGCNSSRSRAYMRMPCYLSRAGLPSAAVSAAAAGRNCERSRRYQEEKPIPTF